MPGAYRRNDVYSRAETLLLVVLSFSAACDIAGCSSGPEQGSGSARQTSNSGTTEPLAGSNDPSSILVSEPAPRDTGDMTAARPSNSNTGGPAVPAPKTRIDSSTLDETVAVVRGENIAMKQLLEELLDVHGAKLLDDMVTRSLVAQEWKRLGITFSELEMAQRIDQEIALRRKELEAQTGTADAFEAFLSFHGHSTESFRELLRTNENFANQIRLEHWFVLVRMTQDKVEVQHLLLDTEAAAAEALEKIQKGADFAKLAMETSGDSLTAKTGGKLPTFIKGMSSLGLEFDEAAFALRNPGDLSGVVKSQAGYHVIKLLSKTPGTKGSYETLRPQVLQALSIELPDKDELRMWYSNYRKMNQDQIKILFKKKG
jgi:parvulin-like peptidyl-prolyl isomerase